MSKLLPLSLLLLSACASPCHDYCSMACNKLAVCTSEPMTSEEADVCVDSCVTAGGDADDEVCEAALDEVSSMSCPEFLDWFGDL